MLKIYQRRLLIAGGVIVCVVGLLYGASYVLCKKYLQPKQIRDTLIAQAKARFNRTITLGDDIELLVDWDMAPTVIVHKFTLSNSTWASNPYIFTAEKIEFNFNLIDLLFKKFNINSATLVSPKLYIESNDKENNISDLQKDTNTPGETTITLNIKQVDITTGEITYNTDKYRIDKAHIKLEDDKRDIHLSAKGSHDKMPFNTQLSIKRHKDYFKLDILNLTLGRSDLSGELDIEYSPVSITGDFKSKNFYVKDFSTDNINPTGAYTIPQITIPVDMLHNAKFDIVGKFDHLDLFDLNFKNVNFKTKNQDNILLIQLSPPAKIANGSIKLDLKYDIKPKVPNLNLSLNTSTLKFADILNELFGKTPILDSDLDFNVNVSSKGSDLQTLVANSSGQILIKAGKGEFQHNVSLGNPFTNVLTSILTFDKTIPKSIFSCGVMNFRVENGVANAKQAIGIEAANVKVLGDGMVNLNNGNISFSFIPQTISANPLNLANFSVAQMVQISGTLSKPVISINPTNLLNQSTGALVAAGLSGGISSVGTLLTAGLLTPKTNSANFSPCKTALEK